MGQRYCSILKHLDQEFLGLDIRQPNYDILLEEALPRAHRLIMAVPTQKHVETIQLISAIRKKAFKSALPILCEKPLVTKADALRWVRKEQEGGSVRVYCVNQYAHLPQYYIYSKMNGRTYYNYFKHGTDGLPWDCFQLFVLARDKIVLNDLCPVWTCKINGTNLNLGDMDQAYVSMVKDFIGPMHKVWDLDTAEIGTRKVLKWIAEDEADALESQDVS